MGEISKHDEFGQVIISTVKKHNLRTVLEIGSWDGTGSTQCFIEALKDLRDPKLFCIELREDRFSDLKNITQKYPWVECINQSTISHKTFIYKSFDEIWDSPFNKIKACKSLVKSWYDDDMRCISGFETGYLDSDSRFYDAALIDGGEFFGYSEYMLIKDRVNFLFLDDYYSAFKTNQIARELIVDPEWEIVAGNRYIRNGYAVFKRKQPLQCGK